MRIPVLISLENGSDVCENVLDVFRSGRYHSAQDLQCLTRDGDILLYKAMDSELPELMQNYKYLIADAISDSLRYMRSAGYRYTIFVGSFQSDFRYYRIGYGHCMWLKKKMEVGGSYYFYDYCSTYFMSILPLKELQVTYYTIERSLGDKFTDNFKEIMEALRQANFNLNDASKLLHVHKNTLVYRLDKIRTALNVDPIGNNNDREFVNGFYNYLKRKELLY